MKKTVLLGSALALASVLALSGALQPLQAQEEASSVTQDPLFRTLFPPELIMQHRRAIGLNDEQRDAISRLISDLQGRVLGLQWELMAEVEELATITGRPRVDLDQALDQMDSVLDKEKEIKQAHLEMLVRIKNILTPQQQARLEELRRGAGS
ncbi:MAG: periplasmic heavy metal sensor [Longimicrobiales bacterium]|nr:periplasmic heavy metal sensor [Longimicrobiales bacterium]